MDSGASETLAARFLLPEGGVMRSFENVDITGPTVVTQLQRVPIAASESQIS